MKFFIAFSALVALAAAKPHGALLAPAVAYAHVLPGAPIGVDGRVVDTPEVAHAKAEHAAAHINEKVTLANEAVKSADHVVVHGGAPAVISAYSAVPAVVSAYSAPLVHARLVPGAPIGVDGRVVDTPEVAVAKAEHAAAHINEKVTLANEAVKNHAAYSTHNVVSAYSAVAPAVLPLAAAVSAYSPAVVPAISSYSAYSVPHAVSAYSSLAHPAAVSVW
ncbi:larval/pupal cuticle protein H1C-like [Athalia rosae]|uniref:larval/pupal cuticle protein H1C-like n=1 Tax=Athalia rosae TaxID=37344 RepID=UPI000625A844|nr:larval/pupal cuticle protein H1C-like [Athalia rosae]